MKFFKTVGIFCLAAALAAIPTVSACNKSGGNESSAAYSVSEAEKELKITIGEKEIKLEHKNKIKQGICLLDSSFEDTEDITVSFTDVTVVGGVVVGVSENKKSIIPERGYVIRFVGENASFVPGEEVNGLTDKSTFSSYVVLGGEEYEISYKNVTASGYITGYIYDSGWYSANTCTGSSYTEIAVGKDNIITEINKNGSTSIPEGGFVISALNNTPIARAAENVNIGDTAEYREEELLYTARKFSTSGQNKTRIKNGIMIYTSDEYDTTPICDDCTEAVADADGIIIAVYKNDNAINEIPEGGFVASATGDYKAILERNAVIGKKILLSGKRIMYIVETPETKLVSAKRSLDALKEEYAAAAEAVAHIDFEKASSVISEAERLLSTSNESSSFGEDLRAAIKLISDNLAVCSPCVTVGDRGAWVTVGELTASGGFLVHYKNREEVRHTVAYAKSVGLNKLIVENCAAGYAVYPSETEGMVMLPELNGFDVLAAFKEECEKQDIEFVIIVVAVNGAYSSVAWPENHYMQIYKDKYLLTNRGNTVSADGYITLDVADEDIRNFEISVIEELINKYSPDGLQLDYIRYPLPIKYGESDYEDFGYNDADKKGFIEKYKTDPAKLSITDPLWEKWCEHRRGIITDYVSEISKSVRSADSNIDFTVTCFADYRDRQIFVYQDVELWAKDGLVDGIYPMIYGDSTEYQRKYADEIMAAKTENVNIVLGVGAYVRATAETMCEQLYMPYEYSCFGSATFTLRYISVCGYTDVYRKMYSRPAVPATAPENILAEAATEFLKERINAIGYLSGSVLSDAADMLSSDFVASHASFDELLTAVSASGIDEKYISAFEKDIKYLKGIVK